MKFGFLKEVHGRTRGQEVLFSENMPLREIIVHLTKQLPIESQHGKHGDTLLDSSGQGDEDRKKWKHFFQNLSIKWQYQNNFLTHYPVRDMSRPEMSQIFTYFSVKSTREDTITNGHVFVPSVTKASSGPQTHTCVRRFMQERSLSGIARMQHPSAREPSFWVNERIPTGEQP